MQAKSPPFLMWYDDNPKLPLAQKIADAMAAYSHRWPGIKPTLVLVNEQDVTEVAGVCVRGVTTVTRNTIWVGQEQPSKEAKEPVAA
jgi:hypothetical protein